MKISIKTVAFLFFAGILNACSNSDQSADNATNDTGSVTSDKTAAMDTTHMADTSQAVTQTASVSPEQDFLNFAVPANAKEIIWLNAGLAKGTSKEIKQHAKMMLKDHKKLESTVKTFLSKKPTFTTPALDTANTITINDKTGADWDKAWADKMVEDHNALLDKLKKAEASVTDADLKKIITSTIPVVESHLSMAKMTKEKIYK